jgi:probable phosphoglycerate mutase
MIEILLIRHGETDWNVEKRIQGHHDIPLNNTGKRQAASLSSALLSEPLDAVISSDLQRTMQTARAIARPRGMQVKVEPGLRERCFGAFEGLQYHEIQARYPAAYAEWQARELDARFPEGIHIAETLREFSERIMTTMHQLANKAGLRRIALVTHGGVLDCIYRHVMRMDFFKPRDFAILNASINRLSWDGTAFHVVQWADVAHLHNDTLDEVVR